MSTTCQAHDCCEPEIFAIEIPPALPVDNFADITLSVSPTDSGTAEASQTVPIGSTVSVTATPSGDILSVPVGVDMLLCIDESGSAWTTILPWIGSMLSSLDAALQAAGIGSSTVANRYALVGFGCGAGSHYTAISGYPAEHVTTSGMGHKHYVGGADWGTLAEALTAIALFDDTVADSGYIPPSEDIYAALTVAANNYTWRSDVPKVVLFLTDEDRNQRVYDTGDTQDEQFASIKAELLTLDAHITGVMGQQVVKNEPPYTQGLGMDYTGKIWVEDGAGGFTTDTNGIPAAEVNGLPLDYGTLEAAGAATLSDTGKAWTVNAYAGKNVRLLDGDGAPQIRSIVSNTATALTVTPVWTTIPTAGDQYQIETADPYQDPQFPTGTEAEYFDLLINDDIKGSAWNVNKLFYGDANTIASFTAAYVDSIEENMVQQLQWTFLGWYENSVLVSTDMVYTFIAEDDRDLVARFVRQFV